MTSIDPSGLALTESEILERAEYRDAVIDLLAVLAVSEITAF